MPIRKWDIGIIMKHFKANEKCDNDSYSTNKCNTRNTKP